MSWSTPRKARRARTEDAIQSEWEAIERPDPFGTTVSLPLPNTSEENEEMRHFRRKPSRLWPRRLLSSKKKEPATYSALVAVNRLASAVPLASGPDLPHTVNPSSSHNDHDRNFESRDRHVAEPARLPHLSTDGPYSPPGLMTSRTSDGGGTPLSMLPTPISPPTGVRPPPGNIFVPANHNTYATVQDGSETVIIGCPPIFTDSPLPLTQGVPINDGAQATDVPEQRRLNTIINSGHMISSIHSAVGTMNTIDTYHTAPDGPERRLLIIGSCYSRGTKVHPGTSYDLVFERLSGVIEDTNNLQSVFRGRGYSVETLVEHDFDKKTVLDRVAAFLEPALPGDVRAIVFTGHSMLQGRQASIVPPILENSESFIPADCWNDNIRRTAKPGVIVLSIFASCFSGALMQQRVKLTDFSFPARPHDEPHTPEAPNPGLSQTPIFITFSSGQHDERSKESEAPPKGGSRGPFCDNFLWALAETARDTRVRNWDDFIRTLHTAFHLARSYGATAEDDPLEWLLQNPQNPQITVSQTGPPLLQDLFPEPVSVT